MPNVWEIRNATLPDGSVKTVSIYDSTIRAIGDHHTAETWIDAKNLLLLPGGIDPHVHFRTPGYTRKEDWAHGSRAALYGGITTVFDMPNTDPPLTTLEEIKKKEEIIVKALGGVALNFGFWFGATEHNFAETEKALLHEHVVGVKLFRGSSTGSLLFTNQKKLRELFRLCAEQQAIVAVHAETEELIQKNLASFKNPLTVADHSIIRSSDVEVSAVREMLELAAKTGCSLYLCHLSLPDSLKLVKEAKKSGVSVWAEVCPHHLFLNQKHYQSPLGNFFKVNPPLRYEEAQNELLELTCEEGYVEVVASDHAPHLPEEKKAKEYENIPSGLPGVQTTLPLLLRLVREKRMGISRLVDLISRNAAKIFRQLSQKGAIDVGYDADLVLIDMNVVKPLTKEDMRSKCGWTPYEGVEVPRIAHVIVGGKMFL